VSGLPLNGLPLSDAPVSGAPVSGAPLAGAPVTKARMKWLSEPLGRANRARLELTLGVVVTLAAVVGLSTVIRPDPSKLASKVVLASASPGEGHDAEPTLAPTSLPAPKVPLEVANAVAEGDVAKVDKLYTPHMALDGMLGVAAEAGNLAMTRWLLDHGADVHEDEDSVNAPILLADDHPDVVALLFARDAAQPSLVVAAQAGAKNAVVRLLGGHAALDAKDPSALYAAVSSTRADTDTKVLIATALLEAGADPNRDQTDSPLAATVRPCELPPGGSIDCLPLVRLLVKRGAHARGDALVAALSLDDAVREAVLEAVLAARVEPGATAVALNEGWNLDSALVKRIAGKGIDWRWHDGEVDAAAPLITAVQRGDRELTRALLAAGAPVDMQTRDGKSPLLEALNGAASGDNEDFARIVELLLAHGVDVNRRLPDGRSPLFAAAEQGDVRILTALLERGARVNEVILDETALDAAERNAQTTAARVLDAHGGRRAPAHRYDRSGDSE
jgi:hypothetical protein